ncbi:hypothetical protein A4G99_00685 [Haladaptatus sp. R4]|uniref:hypothetical protein n=1 Tax=Haladaptatus sp. R4 TaxID=1679489 RepID=UPI0007B4DDC9|nr:hypothetical protein [Haladaptatus sp. R4]KZN25087.1 hypothetical protein A4G99_00685 [Haladaptatus sp. R4]
MNVRDAVEADGGRLAALADVPTDVMADVVHDRTVRVAESDGDIDGFVGYEADEKTVHVTHLFGAESACERLLDEPIRFAERETMPVEILLPEPETESDTIAVAEAVGFEETEPGPWFDGHRTRRFRLENPTTERE